MSNAIKFWKSNIKFKLFQVDPNVVKEEAKCENNSKFSIINQEDVTLIAALRFLNNDYKNIENKIFMAVIDDGIGISKPDKIKLFRLFGKINHK